jgi:hypothetical protein
MPTKFVIHMQVGGENYISFQFSLFYTTVNYTSSFYWYYQSNRNDKCRIRQAFYLKPNKEKTASQGIKTAQTTNLLIQINNNKNHEKESLMTVGY